MSEPINKGEQKASEEYQATGYHGDVEYRFYRTLEGTQPGQIKARVRTANGERRVYLRDLPTGPLQRTFVELTGKKPEDLGLVAGDGGW